MFPGKSEWEGGSIPIKKGESSGTQTGPEINKGIGAGVYGHGMRQKLTFSLGQHTTAFQAEV